MPIHPTAIVDSLAEIDSTAEIGAYVIIDGPVRIAAGTRIYPHAYLTGWTEIGADCRIHPHAVIGHLPQDRAFEGERSTCRIGDRTVLREGATVHRGTGPDSSTVVGSDCYIMANAHIGHDCRVGSQVTLANGALLSGHVQIGDRAVLSGNCGVHQFVRIGELVMVSGCSQVAMDVAPFMIATLRNECSGVNIVGMRRADCSDDEIDEIKLAYRHLYRRGAGFRNAVEELTRTLQTPSGLRLIEFLQAPSKRGFCGRPRQRHSARS